MNMQSNINQPEVPTLEAAVPTAKSALEVSTRALEMLNILNQLMDGSTLPAHDEKQPVLSNQ